MTLVFAAFVNSNSNCGSANSADDSPNSLISVSLLARKLRIDELQGGTAQRAG